MTKNEEKRRAASDAIATVSHPGGMVGGPASNVLVARLRETGEPPGWRLALEAALADALSGIEADALATLRSKAPELGDDYLDVEKPERERRLARFATREARPGEELPSQDFFESIAALETIAAIRQMREWMGAADYLPVAARLAGLLAHVPSAAAVDSVYQRKAVKRRGGLARAQKKHPLPLDPVALEEAALELWKKHPALRYKTEIARKLEGLPVAAGRDCETIRKLIPSRPLRG